jgi:hypothetical protein
MPSTPDITVTNCSALTSNLYAHGSDASGAGGAAWSLATTLDSCSGTLAPDIYRLTLVGDGGITPLGTLGDSIVTTVAPGASATDTAHIYTACPGSTGSGTVMAMTITFLATTTGG